MQLRRFLLPVTAVISLVLAVFVTLPAEAESLSHGRFKNVQIFRPTGPVKQVALFLSGDGGWGKDMAMLATEAAQIEQLIRTQPDYRAMYEALRSTLDGSLPENAPPP